MSSSQSAIGSSSSSIGLVSFSCKFILLLVVELAAGWSSFSYIWVVEEESRSMLFNPRWDVMEIASRGSKDFLVRDPKLCLLLNPSVRLVISWVGSEYYVDVEVGEGIGSGS